MHGSISRIAGAGLLALDVVVLDDDRSAALTFAGGTCGNVLSILSYLHWSSSAVGFIGNDDAGRRLLSDLMSVGVHSRHLVKNPISSTPVFVQRLQRDRHGRPSHTFVDQCPHCGHELGQPASSSRRDLATPIQGFSDTESPDVFFMDRLSTDILALARSAKNHGALIYYEPSAKSDTQFWPDAFRLVDVLKYSRDRFEDAAFDEFVSGRAVGPLWEIQTLGDQGLRYRKHMGEQRSDCHWTVSPAIVAPRVVDTCGAGDWCSAGLLHGLAASKEVNEKSFSDAIRLGQAFAAWACAFVGARGAMYCNNSDETLNVVHRMIGGLDVDISMLPVTAYHRNADPLVSSCAVHP